MNPDRWYYAEAGQAIGPFLLSELRRRAETKQLGPDSHVWQEGMSTWVSAGSVEGLLPPGGAILESPTPPHIRELTGGDPLQTSAASVHYAGFWRRVAALLIDNILLAFVGVGIGVVQGALEAILGPGFPGYDALRLSGMAIAWVYFIGMECSPLQATLGKLALGIRVTDEQGRRIDLGRSLGRQFGKILSTLTLFIGFIMAAFTKKKQALHDILAGCLVVKAPRRLAAASDARSAR